MKPMTRIHGFVLVAIGLVLLVMGGLKLRTYWRTSPSAPSYVGRVLQARVQRPKRFLQTRARCSLLVAWTAEDQTYQETFENVELAFYRDHPSGSTVRLARYGPHPTQVELVQSRSSGILIFFLCGGALAIAIGGFRASRA